MTDHEMKLFKEITARWHTDRLAPQSTIHQAIFDIGILSGIIFSQEERLRESVINHSDSAFGMIDEEAKILGEVHYGCSWRKREDGLYHICSKENREWKVKL